MHRIERILSETERLDKNGDPYYKTRAIVDGEEVEGWANMPGYFKIGDEVMHYFDVEWGQAKMQKPKDKDGLENKNRPR